MHVCTSFFGWYNILVLLYSSMNSSLINFHLPVHKLQTLSWAWCFRLLITHKSQSSSVTFLHQGHEDRPSWGHWDLLDMMLPWRSINNLLERLWEVFPPCVESQGLRDNAVGWFLSILVSGSWDFSLIMVCLWRLEGVCGVWERFYLLKKKKSQRFI